MKTQNDFKEFVEKCLTIAMVKDSGSYIKREHFDFVVIKDDGSIMVYFSYRDDNDYVDISIDDLNSYNDLPALKAKYEAIREERLAKEREQLEQHRLQRERELKERRKSQYLELKKEFGE